MNPTDQTAQWLVALINRLDLLAAAIALFVIVRAIQPLFSGLRNFWKDYAIHSGGHWIGRQKTWLNQHSKFALAEWWGDATGNITNALDRVYGFKEPMSASQSPNIPPPNNIISLLNQARILKFNKAAISKLPDQKAANNNESSFIGQALISWRQFLQKQAFVRALSIAYIYFYGFCLLLAFNELPEATSWQLLILLAGNIALLVAITKWQIKNTEVFAEERDIPNHIAINRASSFAFAAAVAVAGVGSFAIAGAVVIAGAFAFAGAVVISGAIAVVIAGAGAGTGAGAIVAAGTIIVAAELLTSESPAALPISPLELLSAQAEPLTAYPNFYAAAFILLFLVFPWVNAALDWLSVSASRAAFYLLHRDLSAEQREDRAYGKAFAHLVVDLALALAFKLTVLLLLYIYAQLYGEFGVSFSVDTVKAYWAVLNPLDSVPFSWQGLWSSNDHKFITLMVSTTLLPTLLHFGWVLLYVLCRSLWTLLRLLFAFAVSEAATFAATISVLITVAALTVLTMAIDPSDDDKNKENNKTNATQTSELLIPPPHL